MTKREMLTAIAKHVKGNARQIDEAIEVAIAEKTRERIFEVYRFFRSHPEQAGFCLYLLSGIQFKNPAPGSLPENRKRVYDVLIIETLERKVQVEAMSPSEAEDKVRKQWNDEEQMLSWGDFKNVEFEALESYGK